MPTPAAHLLAAIATYRARVEIALGQPLSPRVMHQLTKETTMTNDKKTVMKWLESRKELGRQIDPATAEVTWWYIYDLDPYGVFQDLSEEERQVGRGYFAAAPGSKEWVRFYDLPEATRTALENRPPAGLSLTEEEEEFPF